MMRALKHRTFLKICLIFVILSVIIATLGLLSFVFQPPTQTSITSQAISSIEALEPFFVAHYSNYYKTKTVDLPSFQITLVQTKYPLCADPPADLPKDWNFQKPRDTSLLVVFNKNSHLIEALYEFTDYDPSISTEYMGKYDVVHISGVQTGCGPGIAYGYGSMYERNGKLYLLNSWQDSLVAGISKKVSLFKKDYGIHLMPFTYEPSGKQETFTKMQEAPVELKTTSIKSKSLSSIKALTPFFVKRYSNYYKVDTLDLASFQVFLIQTKYPTCADPPADLPKDWDFNKSNAAPLLVIFDKTRHIIVGLYEFGDSSPTIYLEKINEHPAVLISGIFTGCGSGNSMGSGGIYEENKKLYSIPEDLLWKRKVIHTFSKAKVDLDRIILFTPVEDF